MSRSLILFGVLGKREDPRMREDPRNETGGGENMPDSKSTPWAAYSAQLSSSPCTAHDCTRHDALPHADGTPPVSIARRE